MLNGRVGLPAFGRHNWRNLRATLETKFVVGNKADVLVISQALLILFGNSKAACAVC